MLVTTADLWVGNSKHRPARDRVSMQDHAQDSSGLSSSAWPAQLAGRSCCGSCGSPAPCRGSWDAGVPLLGAEDSRPHHSQRSGLLGRRNLR